MNSRSEIAVAKFLDGYNCAQAVLYSFCDSLGFERDTALRLACGFGAGIARSQQICGAISGGIVVLGLRYGRGEGCEQAYAEETYRKVQELMSRFEAKHGTFLCRALLEGCDLNTPEGQQNFKDNDLKNRVCKSCVKFVVEHLEEVV
jgi:C_GCAxxG_C_C family probable redox protein